MNSVKYNSKPKRPMSAYMLWSKSIREQLKAENPGLKVTELTKKEGEMWRSMKDKSGFCGKIVLNLDRSRKSHLATIDYDNKEWEEKAAKASEQYANDLKAYNANYYSGNRRIPENYRFWMENIDPDPTNYNSGDRCHAENFRFWMKSHESRTHDDETGSGSDDDETGSGSDDDETDEDHPYIPRKRSCNSPGIGHTYVPETVEKILVKTEPVPETVEKIQIKTEPVPETVEKIQIKTEPVPETVEKIQIKTEPVPETVEKIQIKTEPVPETVEKFK